MSTKAMDDERREAISQTLDFRRGWRRNPGQQLSEAIGRILATKGKREGEQGEQKRKATCS